MILHPCAFFLSSSVKEEPKNYIYQKGKGTVTFQVHTGHYLPTLICLLRKLHYSYERNFLFLSLFPFSCPSCFVLYVKKEERNGKSCTSFCNVLNSDEMATMEISKNVFNTVPQQVCLGRNLRINPFWRRYTSKYQEFMLQHLEESVAVHETSTRLVR